VGLNSSEGVETVMSAHAPCGNCIFGVRCKANLLLYMNERCI
jgi:hypothetical protein